MLKRILLAAMAVLSCATYAASKPEPVDATLTIRADTPGAKIDANIYGQFMEHLGRNVYEGIWVGADSPIPNTRGYRNDVLAALKKLQVPVLRWPGGCFADEYHWRDGVGPRDQRPARVNTFWGGVIEPNTFGTHEFFELAEMLGAKTYLAVNVGSGTVQEMSQWVEYITSPSQSSLANERRANGRDKPWKIDYIGVGNEPWGCGGDMNVQYYSDEYRKFALNIKAPRESMPLKVASGAYGSRYDWTEELMKTSGKFMGAMSFHQYTLPTGKWDVKGPSLTFNENDWIMTLHTTLLMDELVRKHAEVMDKYDPEKKVALFVDEWGAWYDVEPGTNPGFLFQQNTLRDAVLAGLNLNIFNNHADRVRMANIAQMINVLQAMVLTDKEKMLVTPTYHVFEMYKPFQNATLLPVELKTPDYKLGDLAIPAVSVSAARGANGAVLLALVNTDPNKPARVTATIPGAAAKKMSARVLTAPAMNTHNTFDAPNTVQPTAFTAGKPKGDTWVFDLPAKSVVVATLN
ncbi:MAG TPA: alpha-L-arabinofuranosidase C-terminal domain-containing protein [Steroidobacteraceae bacterium]|jgi:alpha-N-arabinofuranosidase|nr:alpha-L-arabinofuranosidase C-terminal domain-containing protein [Steroidobacteraceae bacterium]